MDGILYGEILFESGIGKLFLFMNVEEFDEVDFFEVRE